MSSTAKELREIFDAAIEQGWRVDTTGKHPKLYPPDKDLPFVTASSTPSGGRWKQVLIAQLRRSGFVWPWPPPAGEEERGRR